MDAMFIIPALVSPNVNERLVPALAKTIERNTILSYYGSIRMALLHKYRTATIHQEGTIYEAMKPGEKAGAGLTGTAVNAVSGGLKYVMGSSDAGSSEEKILARKAITSTKDAIEYPSGITFFNTIGLEPTYLQIPITQKNNRFGSGVSDKVLTVGFKCVPYQLKGTKDIVALINDYKGRSMASRWFTKKWNSIYSRIPLTMPNRIRNGQRGGEAVSVFKNDEKVTYDIKNDIIYAPNSDVLSDPKALSKLMSLRSASSWATLTILSNTDFSGDGAQSAISAYKDISSAGWGDMIVVNEIKESAYFCTTKMKACYNMPFAYMRNIMNLDNILDYTEVSKWSKPFSMAPLRTALSEDYNTEDVDSDNLVNEMTSIIRGGEDESYGPLKTTFMTGDDVKSLVKPSNRSRDVSKLPSIQDIISYTDVSKTSSSKVVRDMGGDKSGWTDPFDNTPHF